MSRVQILSSVGVVVLVSAGAVLAQGNAARPDFSANNAGWVSIGTDYDPVPGGPKPVTYDPAHRYVPNGSGEQSTSRQTRSTEERFLALADRIIAEISCSDAPPHKRSAVVRPSRVKSA